MLTLIDNSKFSSYQVKRKFQLKKYGEFSPSNSFELSYGNVYLILSNLAF